MLIKENENWVFQETGLFPLGEEQEENPTISAVFLHKKGKEYGIVCKYLHEGYRLDFLCFQEEDFFRVYFQSHGRGEVRLLKEQWLAGKEEGETLSLKVVCTGDVVQGYVNNVLLLEVGYTSIEEGKSGLYGEVGVTVKEAAIEGEQSSSWTYEIGDGGSIKEEEGLFRINGGRTKSVLSQNVPFESGRYTLSFSCKGEGKVTLGAYELPINEKEWIEKSVTYTFLSETRPLKIESSEMLEIKNIQIEKGEAKSSYIPTDTDVSSREGTVLSIPSKKIGEGIDGSLFISISSAVRYTTQQVLLFTYGTLSFLYRNGQFVAKNEIGETVLPFPVFLGTVKMWVSWRSDEILLYEEGSGTYKEGTLSFEKDGHFTLNPSFDFQGFLYEVRSSKENLIFTSEEKNNSSEWKKGKLVEKTKNLSTYFHSTFEEGWVFKASPYFEFTNIPRDGSPTILEDEKGELSFRPFLDEEGKYTNTLKETFVYDGQEYIRPLYEDIKRGTTFALFLEEQQVGQPTYLESRLYLGLSEEEKIEYFGKELSFSYETERSYYLERNEDTTYESGYAKVTGYEGEQLSITMEGERYHEDRLLREVDLNPFVNHQHEGFLVISHETQTPTGFRIFVGDEDLVADGFDSTIVSIDVQDNEGNPVLNPFLEIVIVDEKGNETDAYGRFVPILQEDLLRGRNRHGRGYYRYHAPYLKGESGRKPVTVHCIAKERKSKIGERFRIRLQKTTEPIRRMDELQASESNVVFEYLARFYEKRMVPEKILTLLDIDENGLIGEAEWEWLLKERNNRGLLSTLTNELKEWEAEEWLKPTRTM